MKLEHLMSINQLKETHGGMQECVVSYCNLRGITAIHIANEGKRSLRTGMKLKREGMRKGVPDLYIPHGNGKYIGLWIEFKAGRDRLSIEQKWWIDKLTELGHFACESRSSSDAIQIIDNYFSQGSF